jgi:hypothetical protein
LFRFYLDLFDGYLGDGYPLCSDLPNKAFLRVGAKYRLLGSSPTPQMIEEDPTWATLSGLNRLVVLQTGASGLYDLLCAESTGVCTYPAVVTLTSNLACGASTAGECIADTVSVVEVNGIFYEYIRQPCVEFTFYRNARLVTKRTSSQNPTCANPELPVAGAACCSTGSTTAQPTCNFVGERMKLATAETTCSSMGMAVCSYTSLAESTTCPHSRYMFNWRTDGCSVKAKIESEGKVAVYHESAVTGIPEEQVRNNTISFFGAYWAGDNYPSATNSCGGGSCILLNNECYCDINVVESTVYTAAPPSSAAVLQNLKIGHPAPSVFDTGTYQSQVVNGVTIWSPDGSCCNGNTFFEVTDENGVTHYLKNVAVSVGITGTSLSFRNPPQFNSILTPEYSVADAEHETNALLEQLFYHPNHAPFLATRFFQRFGVSDPSPRAVLAAAQGSFQEVLTEEALCRS